MIIICEPQCVGFEHSEFNAALITVTKYAFPNEKIMFMAEKDHLSLVKETLDSNSVNVEYMEIKAPPRNLIAPILFPFELILIKKVFAITRNLNCDRIIFCSIRRPSLVSVKLMIRIYNDIKCVIVLHNIVEAVTKKPYELTEIPFWLRFWIKFRNISRLRYIALSPSIEIELIKRLPSLKNYVISIDFPYFFQSNTKKEFLKTNSKTDAIKFGFFGVANVRKGAENFFKLAKEIKNEKTRYTPEFILIGPVEDKKLMNITENVFIPSPDKPLSGRDFEKYAEDLDYALIFHKPEQHQLTATASFFDAISYLKPVIAVKNPFVEYYFNEMGNIGYLCDDYSQIKNLILKILNEDQTENYNNQRKKMLDQRERLSFEIIGQKLAKNWE
ncbi:MAG: glycosyltransferase [Candidatus Methanofastidiosum sp.]|nr:glycosyltransferase [Methanofastidiosum sp.]